MTERYARVILYDLNCDHPNHDRNAFARMDMSDPDANEYSSQDWETLGDARAAARRSGWIIRGGKSYCPRCGSK